MVGWSMSARAESLDEARSEYQRGQARFAEGKFEEATTAFERALELGQDPVISFDIGQAHRRQFEVGERLDEARKANDAYRRFLADGPQDSPLRAVAERHLRALDR